MAGTLKKFNVGILVGSPTRGWGTIERVFPLKTVLDPKQSFSAFLVHTLTLADDNQPIEGRGVIPQINISNKNWQTELNAYYNDPGLAAEIKSLFK
jgi:C-terminal processing protease CtpA/Prc